MNNSVFRKTQEKLRKRVQVDVVADAAALRKRVAKPSFYRGMPITDDLAVIQCKVQTLTLNRPIYVEFTVYIYTFHLRGVYPMQSTDTDT